MICLDHVTRVGDCFSLMLERKIYVVQFVNSPMFPLQPGVVSVCILRDVCTIKDGFVRIEMIAKREY